MALKELGGFMALCENVVVGRVRDVAVRAS